MCSVKIINKIMTLKTTNREFSECEIASTKCKVFNEKSNKSFNTFEKYVMK